MSKQMLNDSTFTAANIQKVDAASTRPMTVNGVVGKTFLLLAITLVCAGVGWSKASVMVDGNPLLLLGGFLLLIGLSIAAAKNPKLAPIAGFAYALIMGFWVGAISKMYDTANNGIVTQAGADFAVTATGVGGAARTVDVEVMRQALPAEVGIIAAGGVDDLDAAIALLDAGAQRVATNHAGMMVETLMGVAA